MEKKNSKKTTVILLLVITILIFSIFYISFMLNQGGSEITTSPTVPKKIKAANVTYQKLLAVNRTVPEEIPTEIPVTSEPSPTITPSPTEIVLAYQNPTITTDNSIETISPTRVEALPESGFINNALIIFAASSLLIFISFIF